MRFRLLVFLLAGALIGAVGCSDSGKPTAKPNSSQSPRVGSSPATSSDSLPRDPQAQAQADLDAYWAMLKRLYTSPDPSDPEIDRRAVDPSAAAIRDLLTTRKAQGEVAEYDGLPYHVGTTVTSISTDSAQFEGCVVDGGRLVVAATGQVVDDKVSTSRITGSMVLAGGTWKVQRFDVLRKAEGELPCESLA